MHRVWKWLRESSWKWLHENIFKAVVLATLVASVTGWLRGTFDEILREQVPSGAKISCIGREWITDYSPFRLRIPINSPAFSDPMSPGIPISIRPPFRFQIARESGSFSTLIF